MKNHLQIWGGALRVAQTFDGFKAEHGIRTLELVSLEIDGQPVDVWIDEEGRLGTQWADPNDSGMLTAIRLHHDYGTIDLVGPVLLTGEDFGPLPDRLKISWQHGLAEPL